MAKLRKQPVIVSFISLGCPKNAIDSERMLAEIAQEGMLITSESDKVDILIVNTCGFIAPAQAESLGAIKEAVALKRSGRIKKVIVTGCLCNRMGDSLLHEVEGVDAIVNIENRDFIGRIIREVISSNKSLTYLDKKIEEDENKVLDDRTRLLTTPGHWAYLRISEGCDHKCSFCTIPSIRGRFRSKPQELIIAEAEELVSAGAVELNLVAQDTTYYGRDLKIKGGLSSILRKMEKIDRLKWVRLMYLYPTGLDNELIDVIANSGKIVHYLDMPIQHVNRQILKSMRRPGDGGQLKKLIDKLRNAMSDIVLRTTLIVGYPGETDRQFEELVDFIEWAKFDALGCFEFYPESGTAAALMPSQVPGRIKKQRLEELMLTQQKIVFAKNEKRIGQTLTCLVDSVDGGTGRGRFYGQAPDIDSVCIINKCSVKPGCFVETKVVGTRDYDLIVERI